MADPPKSPWYNAKREAMRERFESMNKLILALILLAPIAASAMPSVPYLPVPKGAAVILDTGSTNTLGYRIVVRQSGEAEYINGPKRAMAEVPPSLSTRFFKDLQAAMPP